jgi:transposase
MIQALKAEPRIMRYELNDSEWTAIKPLLPNKPLGVRQDQAVSACGYPI